MKPVMLPWRNDRLNRKITRMHNLNCWFQVRWSFKKPKALLISTVISTGGHGCPAQTGNTPRGREVPYPELKTILLFISLMKMRRRMQHGPAKNCPLKRNGNLPQGVDSMVKTLPGAMRTHSLQNPGPTPGRANFRI